MWARIWQASLALRNASFLGNVSGNIDFGPTFGSASFETSFVVVFGIHFQGEWTATKMILGCRAFGGSVKP